MKSALDGVKDRPKREAAVANRFHRYLTNVTKFVTFVKQTFLSLQREQSQALTAF